MVGMDFVSDKGARTPMDPGTGVVERIATYAREEGAIVRPAGNVIILSPPLVIEEPEIDIIIAALTKACARYEAET